VTEPTLPQIRLPPHIGADTTKSVVDALHVGWLGMGAITQAFEAGIAQYLGCGIGTCRHQHRDPALHLGPLAAGGPGRRGDHAGLNFVADQAIATGAAPACATSRRHARLDPDKVAAWSAPRSCRCTSAAWPGESRSCTRWLSVTVCGSWRSSPTPSHAGGRPAHR
jgi:dTDP-4-amino-4,6-dideoxygalactose transaminase